MVVFGALDDFATATSARCSVGSSGTAIVAPPDHSAWFLVAGVEGTAYSSFGQSTAGERVVSGVGGLCSSLVLQDTSAGCP